MEKTCIICGNPFTPVPKHSGIQLTCSAECRKTYNYERIRARQRDPEFISKRRKHYYETHQTLCQLCGKVVEHPLTVSSNAPTARMHDECVYEDCRRSLLCGKRLNHVQQLRLMYRGYGISEFEEECKDWRDEHMPMSACNERLLKYVPLRFQLAVDRIQQNTDTGLYELDLRTGFKANKYIMKELTFRRMGDIRTYFTNLKKKKT